MYQLSATLRGHSQDVKDITAVNDNKIASVSRDGSLRVWTRSSSGDWEDVLVYQSDKFLNAVCYDKTSQTVYYGGQDTLINGSHIEDVIGSSADPMYTLVGHTGNVCGLRFQNGLLLSSSWDKTAKIWDNNKLKYDLRNHEASVWDSTMVSDDIILTASADKSIGVWMEGKLIKKLSNIHDDVIRHLEYISNDIFASCSNDGTIKLLNLEGEIKNVFEGHESFVYCVKHMNNTLFSCGEDSTVRIWSINGSTKQVIRIPAVSVWNLDLLPNGDFVICCSDNTIRIFTEDQSRVASKDQLDAFKEELEKSAINSETINFDESKLSPYEVLSKPGKKEGQLVVVKSPEGVTEAHQFSCGQWIKIGDVVGSATSGSDQKKEYEGKMYDYVFDVDVKENEPPLKLPVNITDNPYDIADKFIARYELPPEYRDQIVQFILTNTTGMKVGDTATSDNNRDNSFTSSQTFAMFPVTKILSNKNFNADSIFNGIVKFNLKEQSFDDEDLGLIGSSLQSVDESWEALYGYANRILKSWENKIPAFDILRVIVDKLPDPNNINDYIDLGLSNKDIVISMLTVKILVNIFSNKIWGPQLLSSPKVYENIFETIETIYDNATEKKTSNLAIAVSTLLFNFSTMVINDKNGTEMLPVICDTINTKFGPLEEYQANEEASYRLLMAYGNMATIEPTLLQYAKSITWIRQMKHNFGHIDRFKVIFTDLKLH
ncbi:uncharacterized protein GVI51_K00121 [Nakaseomyces glabratus]|uniref:Protein DOA1 n=2 Tax=Candida glabrata TaxID=5478 RepID=Q6FNF8_CANGA|nr:uncharacterized protein CAGL0K00275g [Nakaseomyces glabratus]KAH7582006.1 Trp-Asp (WD) repeats profile [Nakaseomyces glabratus]KAH7582913.1 Trp-Asp (WD) repeats profile [Nakaseomyces glabratus]KAH7584337.1 Trp-Asp (WD) repeats profile [Nakaseomyces glabratus]KAH7592432.1 Trp-Asp (WD) repeats profile [Nakaseomyces glabratus]KAH7596794.1 Trp-Asp (WD) repeats profile [Nakaseomyces glabratus]|eukprot:XP_448236.1 uncharacterized protein CAGL0K00275g [[Candida] glabrata]